MEKIEDALYEAEIKAWESLARYKFWMFGYWAGIWVHLNRVEGRKRPNPFKKLVGMAQKEAGSQKVVNQFPHLFRD